MKKILIASTILLITALLVGGLYYQDNPLMWLASSSAEYMYVRFAVLFVLIVLFLSKPPRAIIFRIIMMALAGTLSAVVIAEVAAYKINIIDMIVFTQVIILLAIEALETPKTQQKHLDLNDTGKFSITH